MRKYSTEDYFKGNVCGEGAIMEFEKQKPINDEFRKNWERIYRQQEERKSSDTHEYKNGCPILNEGKQKDDL
jgi:hypothetical protein